MKLRTALTLGLLSLALVCAPRLQAQSTWLWSGASGNWATGTNWNPTSVPSAVAVLINNGATVTVNSAVSDITTLNTQAGSKVTISSGGSLTVTGGFRIGSTGIGNLLTITGGSLSTPAGNIQIGSGTANSATVNFSGGTWSGPTSSNLVVNSGATFNISGTASLTGLVVPGGSFNQSGGTINASSNLNVSGTYSLSGGSLQVTGANRDLNISAGAVFKVIGSAATFNLNRYVTGTGTLAFELDNSANHITTIQVANTGAMNRSGTLAAGLAGGVLLSGNNHFDLIEAPSFSAADFTTKPTSAAGDLWDATIANDVNGIRDAVRITLNSGLLQGNITKTSAPTLTLSSNISKGYITLTNLDDAIVLNLSLAGGVDPSASLASFESALTSANVTWSASALSGYDIALSLNGALSGKNYFAWDFGTLGGIATGYGIDAISIVAVPEPGAVTSLVLGSSLLLLGLRKRRYGNRRPGLEE